jgi:translocator protein
MMKKMNVLFAVLNVIGFAGVVVINALANILPINGKNTGQLSDAIPNLFVPAGLTFSIWGIIYLALLAFSVYQFLLLFKKDDADREPLKKIGIFFFLSCLANAGWILAWHYQQLPLSLLVMLCLLAMLLAVYLRLGIGTGNVKPAVRFFLHAPFSIYLGWITVATIANVTAVLVTLNWNGFGLPGDFWTIAVIIAGTLITLLMLLTRNDIFYSLVVVWAFAGIILKRVSIDPNLYLGIIVTAAVCSALILVGAGIRFRRWRKA